MWIFWFLVVLYNGLALAGSAFVAFRPGSPDPGDGAFICGGFMAIEIVVGMIVGMIWWLCQTDPSAACAMLTSAQSSLGWDSFKDVGSDMAPKTVEWLTGTAFALGAEEVTFGVAGLLWVTNFGFVRWILPEMCTEHPDHSFSAANLSGSLLAQQINSEGLGDGGMRTLFTSKKPWHLSGRSCIPFPDENAGMTTKFCSKFGLSHPVADLFLDDNFAQLRDREAQILWTDMGKLMEKYRIAQKVDSSPATLASVCSYALGASMCMDAFPPCDRHVLTPCAMACINLRLCFAGVMGMKWMTYQEDFLPHLDKIEKFCVHLCNASSLHSMDEPVPVGPLEKEFFGGGSLSLSARLAVEPSVPMAMSTFPLAASAACFAFAAAAVVVAGCITRRSSKENDAYFVIS